MAEYESQCVVWQTALNPVIALELLATGVWQGAGVRGPESFPATPFLELMARDEADGGYGQRWGLEDRLAVTAAG
jgi:saccharopine dehydrogenase-like NADP-dependent oxidoreductase